MATEEEVKRFLIDFKHKLDFWGIVFRTDRRKNYETMIQLEYLVEDVKKELRDLEIVHYSEGPITETLYKGTYMWVFGKSIQSREVYIKISLGQPSSKAICISFHFAEHSMAYPFK